VPWPWLSAATKEANGFSSECALTRSATSTTAVLSGVARVKTHQVLVVRSLNSGRRSRVPWWAAGTKRR
jgi:hypothetical protein